jgi:hypothetical protein
MRTTSNSATPLTPPFYPQQVDDKLGTSFLSELQDEPISCSGVTIGTSEVVLEYLQVSGEYDRDSTCVLVALLAAM